MRKIVFWVGIFAALALASCVREMEQTEGTQLVFRAVWGEEPATRTMLQSDGTSIWWTPGEEINAFYGTRFAGKFTSTNTQNQALASFQGSLTVLTGTAESDNEAASYWAVYPYDESNICDGESVTLTVPAVQAAAQGTFADKLFPAVATSSSLDLAFFNVCGGVRFSVAHEGIQSVTFKAIGGEPLAGKVRVGFGSDGRPEVKGVLDGQSEVTVISPEGGFIPGEYYFGAFLPQILSQGLSICFQTSALFATYKMEHTITVNRSRFGKLDEKDKDLTFSSVLVPEIVDLGLSVKWASFNLGASAPEEFGDYYAWGETEPNKQQYDWTTYKWCMGSPTTLTKYCSTSFSGYNGFTDDKTVLDPEDDAAYVNLGGNWRMPTLEEIEELHNNCTAVLTTENDINGFRFTSKKEGYTDKSIFLPAAGFRIDSFQAGYGYYWSSSLDTRDPYKAWYLQRRNTTTDSRSRGQSVRPVYLSTLVSSIQLNDSSLALSVGDVYNLIATVLPDDASRKTLIWASSDASVVTVEPGGQITAVRAGSAVVSVIATDGSGSTASCVVTVNLSAPEAIDLGLSVKWASFNLGASFPEDYWEYYAWGETEPKQQYDLTTYKWCMGSYTTLTKYCSTSSSGYNGFTDDKTVLDPEDDVAYVNLGGNWRMPTLEEIEELSNNCTAVWTKENDINGLRFTSKKEGYTDKSIFLPAAGFRSGSSLSGVGNQGDYWSSSLDTGNPFRAYYLSFSRGSSKVHSVIRYSGQSVRPVYLTLVSSIQLNNSSLTLSVGDEYNLIATVLPNDASRKTLMWTSSDASVVTVESGGQITAVGAGSAVVSVTTVDGSGSTASCMVTVGSSHNLPAPEAVDLGLSVKWGSWNVGATAPEDYGTYFAWGETEPKDYYLWNTYKFELGRNINGPFSKYVTYGYYGTVDNKTVLDPEDDAATVDLGGKWRMPTDAEWTELSDNCAWTWTTENGVTGLRVSAINGNSIFLPAAGFRIDSFQAGYGYYWSSSLDTRYPYNAWFFKADPTGVTGFTNYRMFGYSVRPVSE